VLPYSPGVAGTVFLNTLFGGISGLDYDAATGTYYALSDDRSQNAPAGGNPAARFYTLSIALDADGFVGTDPVTIQTVTPLQRPDGTPFPLLNVDPESIRVRRDGESLSLLFTSEGAASNSSNPPLQNPFVRETTTEGAFASELATPRKFFPDGVGAAQTNGARNNLAFENLTFSPDQSRVYAATESALVQDGPIASLNSTANSRIVEFDVATGAVLHEYVYVVDSFPVNPQGVFADNGLAELLAVGEGTFLALERSFVANYGNHVRIYRVEIGGSTDVSGMNSLAGQAFLPVTKTLVFTMTPQMGFNPDNLECLSFGPPLPDGSPTFVLASDKNFNAASQVTHFILLSVINDGDLNGDGVIDGADLALLLSQRVGPGTGDLNGDGIVNAADLAIVLGRWTA